MLSYKLLKSKILEKIYIDKKVFFKLVKHKNDLYLKEVIDAIDVSGINNIKSISSNKLNKIKILISNIDQNKILLKDMKI